jgi:hypothetical protein
MIEIAAPKRSWAIQSRDRTRALASEGADPEYAKQAHTFRLRVPICDGTNKLELAQLGIFAHYMRQDCGLAATQE